LLDYRYDTISRVSLGYRDAPSLNITPPDDSPIPEILQVSGVPRTPTAQGTIVQAALRMSPHDLPEDPVGELAALMGWPLNPDADHIATWTESDPAQWRQAEHPAKIEAILRLLPDGVALAGSDYIPTNRPPRLDERIQQGIEAARRVMRAL
jgi:hypothetical protein